MTKPNIVFIMIDDMGWRDLACYGSDFYETPNIDRLAQKSVRFTNGYAACPVCSPTRASFLTGKYPATLGLTSWINHDPDHEKKESGKLLSAPYVRHMEHREQTLAHALKAAGYKTWHVGKWHLGQEEHWPENHGFEVNIGGCQLGAPHRGYFSPWEIPTLEEGAPGEYLPDRLTTEACRLIRKNAHAPFFLSMSHYLVHTPIQAKEEHVRRFTAKAEALGLDKRNPFQEGPHFKSGHQWDKRIVRRLFQSDPVYAAMIWSLDESVGQLLDTLEETGQADNTIIIFTSDNGGLSTAGGSPTCNLPLQEGKGWMYEGGVRVPLFVSVPGVTPPGETDVPVTTPDLYPTILDMCGLAPLPEQHLDGISFAPLLRGNPFERGEPLFWHFPHYANQGGEPASSIRWGEWKLIEFFEDGRKELYNLRDDIGEEQELSARHPQKTHELLDLLQAWRKRVAARIPKPNPAWDDDTKGPAQ